MAKDANFGEALVRSAQRIDNLVKRLERRGTAHTDLDQGRYDGLTQAEGILREEYEYAMEASDGISKADRSSEA